VRSDARSSGGGFVAEVDRDAMVVVLEDGDEFESRTKSFEVALLR
jgi:hypothetical protein